MSTWRSSSGPVPRTNHPNWSIFVEPEHRHRDRAPSSEYTCTLPPPKPLFTKSPGMIRNHVEGPVRQLHPEPAATHPELALESSPPKYIQPVNNTLDDYRSCKPTAEGAAIQSSRRYGCPICRKAFRKLSNLRVHGQTHAKGKPFKCSEIGCTKSFGLKSNARRHERNCHLARYYNKGLPNDDTQTFSNAQTFHR